ncbi:urea amidolyase associated protein UAAP1 [Conexibacter sp. SYSU D00693]|uniref:urea amidolyase associated protein UAAP1 n=1 Tax=Conexibacter sp. SYSU D00693 TaxID=2812560 RepID=UPI00196A6810|nr:urea amidolyase associated protein UAAP1 [Conexibacter sp. SYSU D00693]
MAGLATTARVIPGAATTSFVLRRGFALELEDLQGGANAALLLLNPAEPTERLNVPDSLKAQHVARVTAGVALMSDMGRVMASVVEDTCGWHDPLCGHGRLSDLERVHGPSTYAAERNAVRRGAREELVLELAKHGLGVRDLAATVNLFSKVTVDEGGRMALHPGASAAGSRVVLRADMDVLVLLNTAPHPLDDGPWDPKPVALDVREVGVAGPDDPVRLACPENERAFAVTDRDHVA